MGAPVRVGEAPAKADVLWEDARIYGFGDTIGFGGYTALAVREGTAHPMWIDTRNPAGQLQEVYTARLDESAFQTLRVGRRLTRVGPPRDGSERT